MKWDGKVGLTRVSLFHRGQRGAVSGKPVWGVLISGERRRKNMKRRNEKIKKE
jgi:hypothetical protein